jgi:hypothetical protein
MISDVCNALVKLHDRSYTGSESRHDYIEILNESGGLYNYYTMRLSFNSLFTLGFNEKVPLIKSPIERAISMTEQHFSYLEAIGEENDTGELVELAKLLVRYQEFRDIKGDTYYKARNGSRHFCFILKNVDGTLKQIDYSDEIRNDKGTCDEYVAALYPHPLSYYSQENDASPRCMGESEIEAITENFESLSKWAISMFERGII